MVLKHLLHNLHGEISEYSYLHLKECLNTTELNKNCCALPIKAANHTYMWGWGEQPGLLFPLLSMWSSEPLRSSWTACSKPLDALFINPGLLSKGKLLSASAAWRRLIIFSWYLPFKVISTYTEMYVYKQTQLMSGNLWEFVPHLTL